MVLLLANKSQKGVDDDPFNALSLSVIISITFQFNFKVEIYEYWSPLKNSLFQRCLKPYIRGFILSIKYQATISNL